MAYDPNAKQVSVMAKNSVAKKPIDVFKEKLNSAGITARLGEMMSPRKMARFKSTLVQVVSGSNDLMDCNPMSVISAAMQAANLNLDISPSFGYAAIVPYNNTTKVWDEEQQQFVDKTVKTATFQLMVNGWRQLAARSGTYEWINAGPVYSDEYRGSDLLSGEIRVEAVPGGFRDHGNKNEIVGFFAAYRLLNGGHKVLFMTLREIEVHARTYSKSYGKKHPLPIPDTWKGPDLYSTGVGWEKNWFAMAEKTVTKQLLRKYGVLSIEMEEAIESDQAAFSSPDSTPIYVDGKDDVYTVEEAVDSPALEAPAPETEIPQQKRSKKTAPMSSEKPAPAPAPSEAAAPPVPDIPDDVWNAPGGEKVTPEGEIVGEGPELFQEDLGDFFDE